VRARLIGVVLVLALMPDTTDFTLTCPYGSRPGAPAWIVAGDETFVAQILGSPEGNNWFAYPARFLGCTS
jgi:hypothetical protein